jgi:class 3 adenylate cyclase
MEKYVILCVDDERSVLNGIQAQLHREFGREFTVEVAESGEESLELIEELIKEGIDLPIIISDQLMPGLKGNELLAQVHRILPDTLKVLLTGQSDIIAISEAVNKANLYRYIEKPWDGQDLILTVKEAIRVYYINRELEEKNKLLERHNKELEELVKERTSALIEEKKKSDNLLLNILPKEIATELKNTGKATTKKYRNVSILFTDFIDFTTLVASIPATKLVEELNEIFSRFDDIMEKFQIEKIETIGDAYMAASGLPEENSDHALRCVNAAKQMLSYLSKRNETNKIQWNMRVGIHSGPVVAGVVGKKKFAYDLFGDTVNTASRIETNSLPGKINVSQTTFELLKDDSSFSFESRGKISAKGKGELDMWFIS